MFNEEVQNTAALNYGVQEGDARMLKVIVQPGTKKFKKTFFIRKSNPCITYLYSI